MLGLTLVLSGCATTPPPAITDACAWLKQIVPDAGFETRWTRAEKQQVLAFDNQVESQCRKETP